MSVVARPHILLEGLEELDALIEMHEVKHAIVQQVQMLLITAYRQKCASEGTTKGGLQAATGVARDAQASRKESTGDARASPGDTRFDGHKLHTVFYGPPGVGKSKAARCMAKLWHGIGITKRGDVPKVEVKKDLAPEAVASSITEIVNKLQSLQAIASGLESGSTPEQQAQWKALKNVIEDVQKDKVELMRLVQPVLELPEEDPEATTKVGADTGAAQAAQEDPLPLVVCGREDFVGSYQGTTAPKTLDFLMRHRGKVIIVEEAYLLFTDEKDQFGMEALTVLNRFMDEHADEVIIVFTGYKDLLLRTVFAAQPGLCRRFQWLFEVKGYTPAGMTAIFRGQLAKDGWTLDIEMKLEEFFVRHLKAFPAFGGDTERLVFSVKLAHSELSFARLAHLILEGGGSPCTNAQIDTDVLQRGFEMYMRNKAEQQKEEAPEGFYT